MITETDLYISKNMLLIQTRVIHSLLNRCFLFSDTISICYHTVIQTADGDAASNNVDSVVVVYNHNVVLIRICLT